jgi:diguanylate cyclase (GGDEF)-like protein/PAS domain S-box-containing protein
VHKLLTRQLGKATKTSGEVDLPALAALVSAAYEQSDADRQRTDRSISLMVGELEQLNRELDRLVQERTAELREREFELQAQNLRFDAALENMPHGLCMFDRNERLIVCNQRYGEMYGLSAEQAKAGVTLRAILEARVNAGFIPEDAVERYVEHVVAKVRKCEPYYAEYPASDGRTFGIDHRPMADGGWVAIHQDITAQKKAETQIAFMARHDGLTGLANRSVLLEKMEEAFARLRRHGSPFTVFMLDLDLFKIVNDSLGHPVGDELLQAVAARLLACTRETDTVVRLGGDEFAILATADANQQSAAIATANRILAAISTPFELDGNVLNIGTSIGITLAPAHGSNVEQIVKNVDLALYKAKAEGRDAFRFFEASMGLEANSRRAHQRELRSALENDEFVLHYQPIVDIAARETASVEALIRWRHPQRGMIPPLEFIPLAEETGLINPIGEWVLRKACADAAQWPANVKVSVNLSAVQFRRICPIENFRQVLDEAGLPAERLELEITETVLLQGSDENVETLHQLRRLGISIVLDDFGTGYSSLSYLRMFPFDKIKIDRSFVHELAKSEHCASIVSAVAGLGRNLRIGTVAEGVETEDQLTLVRAAGCTHAQGYLFGKPCPAAELQFRRFEPRKRNRVA